MACVWCVVHTHTKVWNKTIIFTHTNTLKIEFNWSFAVDCLQSRRVNKWYDDDDMRDKSVVYRECFVRCCCCCTLPVLNTWSEFLLPGSAKRHGPHTQHTHIVLNVLCICINPRAEWKNADFIWYLLYFKPATNYLPLHTCGSCVFAMIFTCLL